MNTDRDEHLKDADSIRENVADSFYRYITAGTLTAKDVVKHIEVPFNYLGESVHKDKEGKLKLDKEGKPYPAVYTFDGEFKINRVDYHIGEESMALGDEVTISFSIETRKK